MKMMLHQIQAQMNHHPKGRFSIYFPMETLEFSVYRRVFLSCGNDVFFNHITKANSFSLCREVRVLFVAIGDETS